MSYTTAKSILDQTLENFPNLQEFKIDFLGKFIRSKENRNNFRQMYNYKQVELQLGYKVQNFRFRNSDDSELGDGPETEVSDEEAKKLETSTMFFQPESIDQSGESDLEYKPQFTQEELIKQGKQDSESEQQQSESEVENKVPMKKVDSFDMFAQIQKSGMTDDDAMQVLNSNYQQPSGPNYQQPTGLQFGKKKKAMENNIAQLEAEAKQVLQKINQSKVSEDPSKEAAFKRKGYNNMDWLDRSVDQSDPQTTDQER